MLCFLFLQKKNSEYMCLILFLVLHILLFFLFVTDAMKGVGIFITIIPFSSSLWNGKISTNLIFEISWTLLLISHSLLINTYRVLHKAFLVVGKSIDLGDVSNYSLKDNLKVFMITTTVFLWMLILINIFDYNSTTSQTSSKMKRLWFITKNNTAITVSVGALVFSSLSVYYSQLLMKRTSIITTQNANM
jgi:hypothetical protein